MLDRGYKNLVKPLREGIKLIQTTLIKQAQP